MCFRPAGLVSVSYLQENTGYWYWLQNNITTSLNSSPTDLTAGTVVLVLLVPLALAFLVHLHFGLRHNTNSVKTLECARIQHSRQVIQYKDMEDM